MGQKKGKRYDALCPKQVFGLADFRELDSLILQDCSNIDKLYEAYQD